MEALFFRALSGKTVLLADLLEYVACRLSVGVAHG
jgi:hypothetical protein